MNLRCTGSEITHYSFYLKVLQQCMNANSKRRGFQAHGHLLVGGHSSNKHLGTKLIIFYSRTGDNANARKVFDRMPQRSVVAWTALISGYSQHGKWEESLSVFSDMHREGVKFNQFTYGSALKACTGLQCLNRGKQVQGSAQKSRFVENVFVQSALVDLYSKCGEMECAFRVFDSIAQRDLVSWNGIISGFANQGYHNDAFSMFRQMLREGFFPDSFTLGSLLRASVDGGGVKEVDTIHSILIHLGFESHITLTGSLVDSYVRCGSMDEARQVHKNTKNKDIISCTALITGYSREGSHRIHEAVDLFNEMCRARARMDNVMFCSLLSLCADTASLCLGKQIHCSALCHQVHMDVPTGNALIDMYSKSGDVGSAKQVFDEMEKNLITWTSLISGLGRNGYGSEAVLLYEKMETECEAMKPNEITLLSLLSACSHSGLAREGWRCFEKLVQNHGIRPRIAHISCLVDLLARAGYVEEAYDLICSLKTKTVPDASVWAVILRGCIASGNMVIGEEAARNLVEMDPENSANYVTISGMYADAGFWDSSMKARELLKRKSLLKTRGCSYVCK